MRRIILALIACLAVSVETAGAQQIKVGVVLPYSGIAAELARQIDRGVELYLKLNADKLKPYQITLVKRDSKAPDGAAAKVVTQELILQDNVDILAGYLFSPDAFAVAPLITAGKKVAVIMNAGTAHITNTAPNFVRVSFSMWHASHAMGEAAAKSLQAKTAVIGYSDYPPGKDSRDAFKRAFEASGGKVLDEIPMGGPGAVPDYTPYFQRAKEQKPDVFFIFAGSTDHAPAAVRTYQALGMRAAGIRLIATGDSTPDLALQALGPGAVGMMTMHHYNADLDTQVNKQFVSEFKKAFGADAIPDFMAVQGYDGMAAIVAAIRATHGKMDDPGKVLAALKQWSFESPRGPISIDPATRDIVMNEYLSEIEMIDGRLRQKNIGKLEAVKDPCKELKIFACAGR